MRRGDGQRCAFPSTGEVRIEGKLIKMPVKYLEDRKHYGPELKPAEVSGNLFIDLSGLWIRSCYMKLLI